MEKIKVRVNICGTEYTITSTESDAEYVEELAAQLDEKMKGLMEENQRLSITQSAVLSALEFLDMFKKSESSSENLRSQIQDYLADAAQARTDSEITKRELDRANKEIAALRAKAE